MKHTKRYSREIVAVVGGALFLLLMFGFPRGVITGIARGISLCGSVIVPSMLPMLVLCGFFIRTGLASAIGGALSPVSKRIFALPGAAVPAILMSLIGGYPAGAKMIIELVRRNELTSRQGERMLWFCIGAGPGFLVSAVGVGMLSSAKVGWILFAAQTAAVLLGGVISRVFFPHEAQISPAKWIVDPELPEAPISAFVSAVSSATQATIIICAFVALFSGVASGLQQAGIPSLLSPFFDRLCLPSGVSDVIFPALLEVGGGCAAAAQLKENTAVIMAFITGWGGLSVHFQILSITSEIPIRKTKFWIGRVFSAILTGSAAYILLRLIPCALPAAAGTHMPFVFSSRNTPASIALLLFCAFLVLASPEKRRRINTQKPSA